jgi:hypothetical protein
MNETTGSETSVDFRAEYWSLFRQHAHKLVAWGYADAREKIGPTNEEEDITGFIVEAIQERLDQDGPAWCLRYSVKENNPVPGKGLTGKRRKRPDIIVEYVAARRVHYIFEVKRMNAQKNCREDKYLKEGLMRFIVGEYASAYPEAAMIGYIQDRTCKQWATKIKALMKGSTDIASGLKLQNVIDDIKIIDEFSDEWKSEHLRDNLMPISIYHIAVDCA